MEQEVTGVPPSGSGCQPLASAADASSRSGIPNADDRCEVCGQPALGVASSGYGAISHAYCKLCLLNGAEPISGFHYLYDFVSTDGEGLRSEVQSWMTFKDGRYITWPEFVAERKTGPFCEAHKVHALPGGCALCDYERYCSEEQPIDDGRLDDLASGIEAATAGETVQQGSTEGESPVGDSRDAQPPSQGTPK